MHENCVCHPRQLGGRVYRLPHPFACGPVGITSRNTHVPRGSASKDIVDSYITTASHNVLVLLMVATFAGTIDACSQVYMYIRTLDGQVVYMMHMFF